jgi:protein translocase SecG subunit
LIAYESYYIGVLTLTMVLFCVLLIFLVLFQLPGNESGAGLAPGGDATDAFLGADSSTALTSLTRYAAAAFFTLAIGLSVLQRSY